MSWAARLGKIHRWAGDAPNRVDILRGVSLDIAEGEFIALMGPSGSGKSTLLNILGLLDEPTSGTVEIFGRDAAQISQDDRAGLRSRHVGFVFQSYPLVPYLSVEQNVMLPMGYAGRLDAQQRSRSLLEQFGLTHRRSALPATLSGGERQRVAIARALANEPKMILADEPTGSLDSRSGSDVLDLLQGMHRSGVTLVLVTHDDQISRRAGRIVRMRDGQLV